MRNYLVLVWLVLFVPGTTFGQVKTDSLLKALESQAQDDTNKANTYYNLTRAFQSEDPSKGIEFGKKGLELADDINFKRGIAKLNNAIGINYCILGEYSTALPHFEKALYIYRIAGDKKGLSGTLNNIGIYYYNQGNYAKALQHYLQSLKIDEELGRMDGVLSSYLNIGLIYKEQKNFSLSRYYFNKAMVLANKLGDKEQLSMVLNNYGLLNWEQHHYDLALQQFFQVLDIDRSLNNSIDVNKATLNIGLIYFAKGDLKKAKQYTEEALKGFEQIQDIEGLALATSNLGTIYQKLGDSKNALNMLQKAEHYCLQSGRKDILKSTYGGYASLYKDRKDFQKALEYTDKSNTVKDSLLSSESARQVAEMQTLYETEKKEKEIKLLQADQQVKDLQLKRNRLITYGSTTGLAMFLILSIIIYKSYRDKQKANLILNQQNDEIKSQKHIIEEKNKDITDSIKYASRIQEAIFPRDNFIKEILPKSFVLFKPRDIVSGDFYWFEKEESRVYFAAVDCTGHGVPGAFMSIVGHNGLTKAVKEKKIQQPSLILDFLTAHVNETLRQKYEESTVKDGMDISLCCYDMKKKTIEYAGAYNPIWIILKKPAELIQRGTLSIEDDSKAMIEIKADKQPIGSFTGEQYIPFTNITIPVKNGDRIYLFSDGYADQFGGPKGKKFKYKPLQEILFSIQDKPLDEHKAILDRKFEEWKAGFEQIDDVCLLGIEIA